MRGFFFIVVSFLFLTYIFLSLYSISKIVELQNNEASYLFEGKNVHMIALSLDEDSLRESLGVFTRHALKKTYDYVTVPSNPAFSSEENVKKGISNLILYGENDIDNVNISYSDEEKQVQTLSGFIDSLNKSIERLGYKLDYVNYSLAIYQDSFDEVKTNLNLSIRISDIKGSSFEKSYNITYTYPIDGLPDPGVTREMHKIGIEGERQIWLANYYASSLTPSKIKNGKYGQGWFYGDVVSTSSSTARNKSRLILCGTFENILNTDGYDDYGAYILTNTPDWEDEGCGGKLTGTFNSYTSEDVNGTCTYYLDDDTVTDKPFIVAPGYSCNGPVLISSMYSPSSVKSNPGLLNYTDGIYNVEKMRGVVACALYVPSTNGPSYLQRFMNHYYNYRSSYGIETFLVGKPFKEDYSKLDTEFFRHVSGIKIKGGAGCKTPSECSSFSPIGHFSLSNSAISRYGFTKIACNYGAPCGD